MKLRATVYILTLMVYALAVFAAVSFVSKALIGRLLRLPPLVPIIVFGGGLAVALIFLIKFSRRRPMTTSAVLGMIGTAGSIASLLLVFAIPFIALPDRERSFEHLIVRLQQNDAIEDYQFVGDYFGPSPLLQSYAFSILETYSSGYKMLPLKWEDEQTLLFKERADLYRYETGQQKVSLQERPESYPQEDVTTNFELRDGSLWHDHDHVLGDPENEDIPIIIDSLSVGPSGDKVAVGFYLSNRGFRDILILDFK